MHEPDGDRVISTEAIHLATETSLADRLEGLVEWERPGRSWSESWWGWGGLVGLSRTHDFVVVLRRKSQRDLLCRSLLS